MRLPRDPYAAAILFLGFKCSLRCSILFVDLSVKMFSCCTTCIENFVFGKRKEQFAILIVFLKLINKSQSNELNVNRDSAV